MRRLGLVVLIAGLYYCKGSAIVDISSNPALNSASCTAAGTGILPVKGSYDTPGLAYDSFVSGNYLYVGDYTSGVQIINISDLANPALSATFDTAGEATRVLKVGNYLYVADGLSQKVVVLNASNPVVPVHVINLAHATATAIYGIFISGNYLYVVSGNGNTGNSRLYIWDITNPVAPVAQGVLAVSSTVRSVAVAGNYAYIGEGNGIRIVDVTNKTSPASVAFLNLAAPVWDIVVSGNYAYAANDVTGVSVIDVASPAAPSLLSSVATPGKVYQVKLAGAKLYAADGAGFRIFSISASQALTLEFGAASATATNGIYLNGGQLILSQHDAGIRIHDTTALPPLVTNSVAPGSYWGAINVSFTQDIPGDIYYTLDGSNPTTCSAKYSASIVVGSTSVLKIISVNPNGVMSAVKSFSYTIQIPAVSATPPSGNFTSPITINLASTDPNAHTIYYTTDGSTPTTASAQAVSGVVTPGVAGSGSLVLKFFSKSAGLESLVTTATYTYTIPFAPVPNPTAGIFVGSTTVTLTSPSGDPIHYTTNASTPTTASITYAAPFNFNTAGLYDLRSLAGSGTVFSAIQQSKYLVMPTGSGFRYFSDDVYKLKVVGNYAYVAGCHGLAVIDVSTPASPMLKSTATFPGGVCASAVEVNPAGTIAFVSAGIAIYALNITDPNVTPTVISNISFTFGNNLKLQGNYLFITYSSGWAMFDVTNPSAMVSLSVTSGAFLRSYSLAVSGNYVFLGCDDGTVRIYNISTPASPVLTGSQVSTGVTIYSVDISGNNLVLANNSIRVYDISNPLALVTRGTYGSGDFRAALYTGNTIYAGGTQSGASGVYQIDAANTASLSLVQQRALTGTMTSIQRVGAITYSINANLGIYQDSSDGAFFAVNMP